jgi:hypothetical protein
MKEPGVDWRIILKLIFKNCNVDAWAGFLCFGGKTCYALGKVV